MCCALACGPALAQSNLQQLNNPQPKINPAPGTPAPVVSAPSNVPPPSSLNLPSTFPIAKPASPALSDPIARQLNIALGLAGALRKQASEGRAGEAGTGELLEQLRKTLLGARENSLAQDRKPGDEVWTQPQSEALTLVDEARQLRLEAVRMQPSDMQVRILQQVADRITRAQEKVLEASRKRRETVANSVSNAK